MAKNRPTLPNLEDSFSEINQLIDKMEHSELSLEQSLQDFERGITLIKHCQKILTDAEQKVKFSFNKIIKNNSPLTMTIKI